ncbi:hypothetical protein GGS23DRAFT_562623 [Durotheca rogersii]|uniref:uncharacterized protein n=1 Tax=Durotheca rogersii TaxID=419775 RepID=UPI00221EEBFA|nr:uncharacterized protein GGS23DRAFT_562623 [Durotheca rogersii]KAI5864023.1 hypothetical protein GGS23DRAFT_562623 [Durotheca rogersii]
MALQEDAPAIAPRQRPVPPPNRRRDKPQLSCNLCRRRKVKCDRQQPCKTCTLRGLGASCFYPSDIRASRLSDREPGSSATVQSRVRELEGLVHALIQRTGVKPLSPNTTADLEGSLDADVPAADTSGEPSDSGTLTNTPAGPSYADGAHWTALLDGISELKEYLQENNEAGYHYHIPPHVMPDYGPSPELLYGRFTQATKGEILSTVPKKPVADRLISKFFGLIDLAPALLHSGQFIHQYESFYADPYSAPIMWVGLLFAIMCVATMLSMPHTGQDPDSDVQDVESAIIVKVYREKIIQCLTLGRYTRGGPYVLETFLVYIASEHLLREDAEFGTHILLGMILQISMRMGYHRDPKNFPVLSPFEGEMRRRIWAALHQASLVFASQMGLPSMFRARQIDTEEPRNLIDSDFDETTAVLPPSRPETEMTPILYVIVRGRVASLWEQVRDIAVDTRLHKYDEILAMDRRMQAERQRLPETLRARPIEKSITDHPQIIMQRIWLEICFLRLKAVLHKKYFMAPPHLHQRYSYSRHVCLRSALKILEYQHIVYEKVQPDHLLYEVRWKLSSVMNNEFLLATSILCAYVKQVCSAPESTVECIDTQEVSEALTQSLDDWHRFSATSRYARTAIKAIRLVLGIAGTPTESPPANTEEEELSRLLSFQEPLLLDFNLPFTFEGEYNGSSSKSISEPEQEMTSFAPMPASNDDWANLFPRVPTRASD